MDSGVSSASIIIFFFMLLINHHEVTERNAISFRNALRHMNKCGQVLSCVEVEEQEFVDWSWFVIG